MYGQAFLSLNSSHQKSNNFVSTNFKPQKGSWDV